MKKLIATTSTLFLLIFLISCSGKKPYYEQFEKDKSFTARILDLNKSIDEIRAAEKGKIIKDDIAVLKYVYEIGKNDSYIVSYLFDEQGCYEIGIDGYFELQSEANNVVDGIKSTINASEFGSLTEDNNLCRWKNVDGSISIELDYKDTARGLFLATIFANE